MAISVDDTRKKTFIYKTYEILMYSIIWFPLFFLFACGVFDFLESFFSWFTDGIWTKNVVFYVIPESLLSIYPTDIYAIDLVLGYFISMQVWTASIVVGIAYIMLCSFIDVVISDKMLYCPDLWHLR